MKIKRLGVTVYGFEVLEEKEEEDKLLYVHTGLQRKKT